jgi:hypothetical protein
MPYFRIMITLKSRQMHSGIRIMKPWNPDNALHMVEKAAGDHYRESWVGKVEMFVLPKSSDEEKY